MVSDELVREWAAEIRGVPRLTGHYADGCITWDEGKLEAVLHDFAAAVEAEMPDRDWVQAHQMGVQAARDAALEEAARESEAVANMDDLPREAAKGALFCAEKIRALKSSPTAGVIMVDGESAK